MFENSERNYIGFQSDLIWTSNDLVYFASSITNIYNAFLAVRIRGDYEDKYYESQIRQIDKYFHLYERYIDHPIYYDYLKYWEKFLRDWRKMRGPYPPPPSLPFSFPFPTKDIDVSIPDEYEIFQKISKYSGEYTRLQIDRIRIYSPGGFSFSGIGEIIKEIRELIKDLWFRNKQERVKGELEIIEKYLKIRRENQDTNLPSLPHSTSNKKLVEIISDDLGKLKRLETDGKLKSIPENLEYRPK